MTRHRRAVLLLLVVAVVVLALLPVILRFRYVYMLPAAAVAATGVASIVALAFVRDMSSRTAIALITLVAVCIGSLIAFVGPAVSL